MAQGDTIELHLTRVDVIALVLKKSWGGVGWEKMSSKSKYFAYARKTSKESERKDHPFKKKSHM